MKRNELIGALLISLGLILLLAKIGFINIGWGAIWPLFILIPGLILEISFLFNREIPGVLVPGGILSIIGATFLLCALFNRWNWMGFLWPIFPFSVAFGLFQLYIFSDHEKELLIPVGILGGVAVIGLLTSLASVAVGGVIPIILILVGGYVLYLGKKSSNSRM